MSSASQFGTLITVDGVAPVAGNVAFTSTGGTITITPGVGTIDFEAVAGAGAVTTIDGVAPVLGNVGLTSLDASITITPGVGTIDLSAAGGGGGITTIDGDTGTASGATVTLTGGSSGTVFTGNNTSTVTMSFNEINLPATTSSALGVVNVSGTPFLHSYGSTPGLNTFVGGNAGNFTLTTADATNNTGVGWFTLSSLTTGANNVGVKGFQSLTTGSFNTNVGDAGFNNIISGNGNVGLGWACGNNYTGSESNNILLQSAGVLGESNVMRIGIGVDTAGGLSDPTTTYIGGINGNAPSGTALLTYTDTDGQVTSAGEVLLPDSSSSSVGVVKINSVPFMHAYPGTGNFNVFLGEGAGNFTLTGNDNTCIGHAAGALISFDASNTFIGNLSGTALSGLSLGNVGVGDRSLLNLTSGDNNCAIGRSSLSALTTGSLNIGVGFDAGNNWTGAEASSILIGSNGVSGDTNVMRLGDDTRYGITSTFVGGIFGATVTGSAVLIDATGLMGTVASSERYKDNIEDLGDTDVLKLRPVSFSYKSNPDYVMQSGLIAEEVDKIMPRLVVRNKDGNPESVMYHELPVLLLNEIKKMSSRIAVLEQKLAASKK